LDLPFLIVQFVYLSLHCDFGLCSAALMNCRLLSFDAAQKFLRVKNIAIIKATAIIIKFLLPVNIHILS
jgi:hypothetical protein